MTAWTIQECTNIAATEDETTAIINDGTGPDFYPKGYHHAWEYIAGNAEPGDTITVLEPFTGVGIGSLPAGVR